MQVYLIKWPLRVNPQLGREMFSVLLVLNEAMRQLHRLHRCGVDECAESTMFTCLLMDF